MIRNKYRTKDETTGRVPQMDDPTIGEPPEYMIRRIRLGQETITTPIPVFDKEMTDEYHNITPWANIRTDAWEERIIRKEIMAEEQEALKAKKKAEAEEYEQYKKDKEKAKETTQVENKEITE